MIKNKAVNIENREARHNYFIDETIECGIELMGSEVKSIRMGHISLKGSWVNIENGEVYLKSDLISKSEWMNNIDKISETRDRRLLLHKSEIRKLTFEVKTQRFTLIPLKVYFNNRGKCKILVGVCKGKSKHDKRESNKIAQMRLDAIRYIR